jgi:hypothetical protein
MTALWTLFGIFAAGLVVAGLRMGPTQRIMRREGHPGIIDFELARSADRVRTIFEAWGAPGRAAAVNNTKWDYLFLVGYGGSLGTAALLARPELVEWWSGFGPLMIALAVAAGAAALCDAVEDVGLLRMLAAAEAADLGRPAFVTYVLARIKWGLIRPTIALVVLAGVAAIVGAAT